MQSNTPGRRHGLRAFLRARQPSSAGLIWPPDRPHIKSLSTFSFESAAEFRFAQRLNFPRAGPCFPTRQTMDYRQYPRVLAHELNAYRCASTPPRSTSACFIPVLTTPTPRPTSRNRTTVGLRCGGFPVSCISQAEPEQYELPFALASGQHS